MSIIWTIIIGFVAGLIARFFHPGSKYEPKGFILTAVLGIIGAVVATYLGQAVGWYHEGESAGFIASIVGAIIVLEKTRASSQTTQVPLLAISDEPLRFRIAKFRRRAG